MRKAMTILAALGLMAVALPTTALGQGNAGVDEYVENLPGPGGGDPTAGGDDSDDPGGGGPLTQAEVASLEELGSDGAAAAALAQGSGPQDANDADNAGGSRPAPSGDDDRSGAAEVLGTLTGNSDSGMGIALPILLGTTLVAALAFLLVRRSRGRPGPA
jgi:hypothetical protein